MKTFLCSILVVLCISCGKTEKSTYDLVISNVNLIDGTGAEIQSNTNVFIKEGKIVAIDSSQIKMTETIIDGTGKFLIPGLFDCHVHTGNYKEDFEKLIHYGVTSIFVPGGSACTDDYFKQMRDIGAQDSLPAPSVFHTSHHFTMKGRHPVKTYANSNWRENETVYFLKDTLHIEELVVIESKKPILGIKLTIEDGPAPPFVERIPQEFIDKTVKEAKKYGLEIYAHVSDNTELKMAVKGGAQNLVHFTGVNIDPENSMHLKLIEQLKERNASWVTTLMIDKSFLYPIHLEWFENKNMLSEYQKVADELTPERIERAKVYIEILKDEYNLEESTLTAFMKPQVEDIQFLYDSGINMVLGTDAGNYLNFHGYSLHEEMQLLELGGMKPLDIIKMGTHNAAKMMKVIGSMGTLEVGKRADMILLDKNPLKSIKNTLAIHKVIKNGKIQQRISF